MTTMVLFDIIAVDFVGTGCSNILSRVFNLFVLWRRAIYPRGITAELFAACKTEKAQACGYTPVDEFADVSFHVF